MKDFLVALFKQGVLVCPHLKCSQQFWSNLADKNKQNKTRKWASLGKGFNMFAICCKRRVIAN